MRRSALKQFWIKLIYAIPLIAISLYPRFTAGGPTNGAARLPTLADLARHGAVYDLMNPPANSGPVSSQEIIDSSHTNFDAFVDVSWRYHAMRRQLGTRLMKRLTEKNAFNWDQIEAAYYLGEMRYAEASDVLSSNITLIWDYTAAPMNHLWPYVPEWGSAALEALVKIGSPCLPAVIRNLAESDDVKTRELSLKVVYRIDGDKDIAGLRLQKALKAEKDMQKQARLQQAMKDLEGISLGK